MKKRTINNAFSLMEVIIWCGIAAIFSTLVGIAGFSFMEKQKSKAAVQEMGIYSTAILDFYSDTGKYPTNEEGLQMLYDKGYITKEKQLDPWKNEYIYNLEEDKGFTIKSLGSDKKEGGEGNAKDIVETHSSNSDTTTEESE
jgi:general secretion pathway protein G